MRRQAHPKIRPILPKCIVPICSFNLSLDRLCPQQPTLLPSAAIMLAFLLKNPLANCCSLGHKLLDFGCADDASCDYHDYIRPTAEAISAGRADLGIVLGGSGNGEAIVANKVPGVRCGLCWDAWSAEMTKRHNNANCISIGARPVPVELALKIVQIWLDAPSTVDAISSASTKIGAHPFGGGINTKLDPCGCHLGNSTFSL